jgi:hypothetical protein
LGWRVVQERDLHMPAWQLQTGLAEVERDVQVYMIPRMSLHPLPSLRPLHRAMFSIRGYQHTVYTLD